MSTVSNLHKTSFLKLMQLAWENNFTGFEERTKVIRVPKVPFCFLDKLKHEIRNKVLIFVSILKLRHKT